jgi:hypothetical protein
MSEPASSFTRIGNEFKFQIGAGSPPTFSNFCAVVDTGAIGESKPQIDVTSLCDDARVFRAGLADGAQITLKCNYLSGDTVILALYQAFKNHTIEVFRLLADDTSPPEAFQFHATILGWTVLAPVGAKAEVNFVLKITGDVSVPVA